MSLNGIDRSSPPAPGIRGDGFSLSGQTLALVPAPIPAPVAPPPVAAPAAPMAPPMAPIINGPATPDRSRLGSRIQFVLFPELRNVLGQTLRDMAFGPSLSPSEENAIRQAVRSRGEAWRTARDTFTNEEKREIAQTVADVVGQLAANRIGTGSDAYAPAIVSAFDLAIARINQRRRDAEAATQAAPRPTSPPTSRPRPQPSRPIGTVTAPSSGTYTPPPPPVPAAPPVPAVLGTAALTLGGSTYTLNNTSAGFTVTNPAYGVNFAVPAVDLADARDRVKDAWLSGRLPGPTPPQSPLTIAGQPFSIVGANGSYGLRDPAGAFVFQLPGRILAEAAEYARAAYFTGHIPGFPPQSNPLTIGGHRLDVVGSHGDFGVILPDGAYAGRVRAPDLGGAVDQIEPAYLDNLIPGLPPNRLTVPMEPGLDVRLFGPGDSGPYGLALPDGPVLVRLRVPTEDGGDRHPTSFDEASQVARALFDTGGLADLGLAPTAPPPAVEESEAASRPTVEELIERYRERRRTFPLESEETAREQVLADADPATRSYFERALGQPLEGAVTDVGPGGGAPGAPPTGGAAGVSGASESEEPEGAVKLGEADFEALAPGEAARLVAAASDADLAALDPVQASRLRNRLTLDALEAIARAPSAAAARDAAAPSLDALARLNEATNYTPPVEGVEGLPAPETNADFTRQVMAYMTPRDQSRWLDFANDPANEIAVSILRAASSNATAFNRSEAAMALMNGYSLQDDIMPWLPLAGPGSGIPLIGPDGLLSLRSPDAPPPVIETQMRPVDEPGVDALVGTQATAESAELDALIAEGADPMEIADKVGEIFTKNREALRRLPAATMQAVLAELDRQRALYTGLETGPIDASRDDVAARAAAMRTAIAQIFTSNVAQEGSKVGEITQANAASARTVASWINGLSRDEIATIPDGLRAALRNRLRMGMFAANNALDPATVTQAIRAEFNEIMPQYRAALDKLNPTLFGPTSALIDPSAPTDRPIGFLDRVIVAVPDSHGSSDIHAYAWRKVLEYLSENNISAYVVNMGDLLNKYFYSAQNIDGQIAFAEGVSEHWTFLRGNHEGATYLQHVLLPERDDTGAPIITDEFMKKAYEMFGKGFDLTIRSYAEAYGRNDAERDSWRAFMKPPNPAGEGVDREAAREWYRKLSDYLTGIIPQRDLDLIRDMALSVLTGDFFFAHAGANPDRTISEQFLTPERLAELSPEDRAKVEFWNTWTRGPILGRERLGGDSTEPDGSRGRDRHSFGVGGGHTMLDRPSIDGLRDLQGRSAIRESDEIVTIYFDSSVFGNGRVDFILIDGPNIHVIVQERHGGGPLQLTEEEAIAQGYIDTRIDPGNAVGNNRVRHIPPNDVLGRGE
ncbi:MAG: metallophosphoesterase [Salinarimonadaceae bacterium]|nr:MAG: metallophosphoesterase [Salinarimonadaceae bacterium]